MTRLKKKLNLQSELFVVMALNVFELFDKSIKYQAQNLLTEPQRLPYICNGNVINRQS